VAHNSLLIAFACTAALHSGLAGAQGGPGAYPAKPIRLVVTFPPGGSSDTVARIVSPRLGERLHQTIVIDNRPGGGGGIGADIVAKAPADGHTLLVGAQGAMALNVLLYRSLPYDPLKDLAPVTLLVTSPFVVAVNPSLISATSLRELIALLKSKPGGTPFASGGNGSGMHLAGELFRLMSATQMIHVPYKGNGQALTDLAGGQVPVAFVDLASAMPFVKSGRIKVLAVASAKRSVMAPDIPSAAESGLPGYEAFGWFGLVAPAATPAQIIARLNADTVAVLQLADVRERLLAAGAEPAPCSAGEFTAFIRAEIGKWAKVVKDSGARVD